MINQVKNRLRLTLFLVLGLTLILLISLFTTLQYRSIDTQNNKILNNALYGIETDSLLGNPTIFIAQYDPLTQQFVALSKNWEIDRNTFNTLMNQAFSQDSIQGQVLNDSVSYLKDSSSRFVRIAFLELSTSNSLKQQTLILSTLSLLGGLVLIGLISYTLSNKLIKPIEKSLEQQKQFIADASHELKNPLQVISNNLAILENNSNDRIQSQMKWIDHSNLEVKRMSRLVSDLLFLSSGDSGHFRLNQTHFNLSKLIKEILLEIDSSLYENNKLIDHHIDPNLFVLADRNLITRAIKILINNAITYSIGSSPITLSLINNQSEIQFLISNQSDPLTPQQLQQLFDRFYRVDPSRHLEGNGLGLAIAQNILVAHDSKIKVTQENSQITFSFKLKSDTVYNDHKSPSDDQ